MGAPSKRAKKVRDASEFDVARLRAALGFLKSTSYVYSWTLQQIYGARDAQMRGEFALAARLAESMRTDDALFVAFTNRLAPQRSIKVGLTPARSNAQATKIAVEADALFGSAGIAIHPDTIADIHGCLVNHGVAFAINAWTVRDDGTRTDVALRYWPIEFVRWDSFRRCFMARIDPTTTEVPLDETVGGEIPIVHGDGRWVVFQKNEVEPFKYGAILPAALVWARHAFAIRDWAKSSVAHGSAKVVGELAEGIPLQSADGALSAEAAAFIELLKDMASSDAPVGIRPAGSKTDFVVNTSTAWQVFENLVGNGEKAAARIYLGTDGTLGSQGGAPGVDITALFGVAVTHVEGDIKCLERGIDTGLIEPWTAINFGDSSLAPKRRYLIDDPDADAARASYATRMAAFLAEVKAARDAALEITQDWLDDSAKRHGVKAPKLASAPSAFMASPPTPPAPTPALRPVDRKPKALP